MYRRFQNRSTVRAEFADQLKEIYEAVVKAAPEYDLERIKEELKIKNR